MKRIIYCDMDGVVDNGFDFPVLFLHAFQDGRFIVFQPDEVEGNGFMGSMVCRKKRILSLCHSSFYYQIAKIRKSLLIA